MAESNNTSNKVLEGVPSPEASEVFIQGITTSVNKDDVHKMVDIQKQMLSRFEKTNEMLLNFNLLSRTRYESTSEDFQQHTKTMLKMKKDLDSIFSRIRILKNKLNKQHPKAFIVSLDASVLAEEEESKNDKPLTSTNETKTKIEVWFQEHRNIPPKRPPPPKTQPTLHFSGEKKTSESTIIEEPEEPAERNLIATEVNSEPNEL